VLHLRGRPNFVQFGLIWPIWTNLAQVQVQVTSIYMVAALQASFLSEDQASGASDHEEHMLTHAVWLEVGGSSCSSELSTASSEQGSLSRDSWSRPHCAFPKVSQRQKDIYARDRTPRSERATALYVEWVAGERKNKTNAKLRRKQALALAAYDAGHHGEQDTDLPWPTMESAMDHYGERHGLLVLELPTTTMECASASARRQISGSSTLGKFSL